MQARVNWSALLSDWRLRLGAAAVMLGWYGAWVWRLATETWTDRLRPTDLGSDVSNYLAAGQRLLAGRPLYELTAGDRPVPFWNPPAFTVPIISPPPMAAPWALASLLPANLTITAWWAACLGVTVLVVTLVALRAPWPLVILCAPLGYGLAVLTLTGNLNSFILGAAVLLARVIPVRPTSKLSIAAGAAVGALSVCKLGPVLLVWWLLVVGARRPFVAAVAAAAVLALVPVALDGFAPYQQFLVVAGDTNRSGATPYSVAGFLSSLHVRPIWTTRIGEAVPVVAALGVLLLRRRPAASFVVAVVGMIWSTPVVRPDTIALLVALTAPWWGQPLPSAIPGWARITSRLPALASPTLIAALIAVAATLTGLGVALARDRVSSLKITNNSGRPIVALLSAGRPTMGFLVEAGAAGTAWGAMPGAFSGSIWMFDAATCEPLGDAVRLPLEGGDVTFGPGDGLAIATGTAQGSVGDLAYVTTCGRNRR